MLIKELGGRGGIGFNMSAGHMEAFVNVYRARTRDQPLLPKLRTLSVAFVAREGPKFPSTPSMLLLLGMLMQRSELECLELGILGPMGTQDTLEWRTVYHDLDQALDDLLQRCRPEAFHAFVTGDDVPASLTKRLPHGKLRRLDIRMQGPAPKHGRPQLNILKSSLARLPTLHTLAIYDPPVFLEPGAPTGSISSPRRTPLSSISILEEFPILQRVQLSSTDFLNLVPFGVRSNLKDLSLNVTTGFTDGRSLVIDSLIGCSNLQKLRLDIIPVVPEECRVSMVFPWRCLERTGQIIELEVRNLAGTVQLPSDHDIEMLSKGCPRLEVLVWQGKPLHARKIAAATLNSLIILAACPLKKLDIPIHVEDSTRLGGEWPRRLVPHGLELHYYQWSFQNTQEAPERIRRVLEDITPNGRAIKDWLQLNHTRNAGIPREQRREVEGIWAEYVVA